MSDKPINPNEIIAGFMAKLSGGTAKPEAPSAATGDKVAGSRKTEPAPAPKVEDDYNDAPHEESSEALSYNYADDDHLSVQDDDVLTVEENIDDIALESSDQPAGLGPDVKKRIKIALGAVVVGLVAYLGMTGNPPQEVNEDPLASISQGEEGTLSQQWESVGEPPASALRLPGDEVDAVAPDAISAQPLTISDTPLPSLPGDAAKKEPTVTEAPGGVVNPTATPEPEVDDLTPTVAAANTNRLNAQVVLAVKAMDEKLSETNERIDSVGQQVSVVTQGLQQQQSVLGRVEKRVNDVADTQNLFNQLTSQREEESTERPDLEVLMITQTTGCEICSPYARVRYKEKELDVSADDTFHGYTVSMLGDRLILKNSKAQFSYYVHK